jgi:hypothetical protein
MDIRDAYVLNGVSKLDIASELVQFFDEGEAFPALSARFIQ